MSEPDELRSAFRALLDQPVSAPDDRRSQVSARISRIRRQRIAAAGVGVAVLVGASGLAVTQLRHRDPTVESVQSLRAAQAPRLMFMVDAGRTGRVGRSVTLDAKLSGKAQSPDRYGWKVTWGDGDVDRAYGASACRQTAPVDASSERSYAHTYVRPGTYTILVETSLCGVVKARATATIVITR